MKKLSAEEVLDLTQSSTVEEFLVKKDLVRTGKFNAHDSYEILCILVAQRKEDLAWKLFEKKLFTVNSWFYWQHKNERSRQKYIEDGMEKFAQAYAKKAWPTNK